MPTMEPDDEEVALAFVRPFRTKYQHTVCATVMRLGRQPSRKLATDPVAIEDRYIYCSTCTEHMVPFTECVWVEEDDTVTAYEVGT